jgi:hypothetical protein
MKTSITWSPAAGLNVVSVERGEQAWTVTVDSRQPTANRLSGMRRTVQIAPQHLLANAPGFVRSRSAGHCECPPRAMEVSQPAV